MSAPNPILDTTSQRAATGMDKDARALILKTLRGMSKTAVAHGFFRDRYADFDDYAAAVGEAWGESPAREMKIAVAQAANYQAIVVSVPNQRQKREIISEAMLLHMPEPDFRLSVYEASQLVAHPERTAHRISSICKKRGIPWEFTVSEGFRWVGGEEVQDLVVRPD